MAGHRKSLQGAAPCRIEQTLGSIQNHSPWPGKHIQWEYALITGQRCKVRCWYICFEISNNFMSINNDPLKITPQSLHRFWFTVGTTQQWYDIIRELKSLHGRNWRGQPKVKRRLDKLNMFSGWLVAKSMYVCATNISVWFDVPDPATATWISIKLGIPVHNTDPDTNK